MKTQWKSIDFVRIIMDKLDEKSFFEASDTIIKKNLIYLCFVEPDNMSRAVFFEKICDYFEKVQFNTGKSFDDLLLKYYDNLKAVVEPRIAKTPKSSKKKPDVVVPRSRKYFDRILSVKDNNNMQSIADYSRIMMCLYSEIIRNKYKDIVDFEYSFSAINIREIFDSMTAEKKGIKHENRFNPTNQYSTDECTFVLLILMYYYLKSQEI